MALTDEKLKKLWTSNQLSGCKLPELKECLKSWGLPMKGTVTDVAKRVGMYLDVKFLDLFVLQDGKQTSPFDLKTAQLRKIVAQLGMDPTGDNDELHSSLIDYLKKKSNKSSSGETSGMSNSEEPKGIMMAKQILEMTDDYPAILSASGINVTTDSSVAIMRKAYLKLSLLIHPDKLQKVFPDATKAFQCLVTAYERLSQPELYLEDETTDKQKAKKIMRSNDGCHRTKIGCPRCRSTWGLPESGVENFDYNFMMMGLKTYNCALCLCDFGCMTAIHECPFCKSNFEYHPNDFHRKLQCSNSKCNKSFGFFLFHISPQREKEYRNDIREKQEKRLKEKEQLQERSKRAGARSRGEIGANGKDKLFLLNLLDQCPRCGEDEIESNEEVRREHLAGCNDKKKIAAYAKQLKEEQESAEKKAKQQEAQEEVQNVHSWEYLGGKTVDMWLLSEKQLQNMCKNYNLDVEGTRDELITRLVHHRNSLDSKRMLTEGGEIGEAPAAKKKALSIHDLPSNMENMSVAQLKALCASHGIVTNKTTKSAILNVIEKSLVKDDQSLLRITDGKKK